MPTTLPRVNVTFDRQTHEQLARLAKGKRESLGSLVSDLVRTQLELMEDMALAEAAEKRLATFKRKDAWSTEDLLRWNRSRRRR